ARTRPVSQSLEQPPTINGPVPAPVPAVEAAGLPLGGPTWRLVLYLAWPVLAQQLLILVVTLSDSFLAGYFQPLPPEQQAEAVGHQVLGRGLAGGPLSGGGLAGALGAQAQWAAAAQISAKHVSYQAAQTT